MSNNDELIVYNSVPTVTRVMEVVFKDLGEPDDVHWILFGNGTFYTFLKTEYGDSTDTNDLLGRALTMCKDATLLSYDDNDCVTVLPYNDQWPHHPVYIVLSTLRARLGWVVIGKTNKWAETDQELASVGYLARTNYELDCEEQNVIATSWRESC